MSIEAPLFHLPRNHATLQSSNLLCNQPSLCGDSYSNSAFSPANEYALSSIYLPLAASRLVSSRRRGRESKRHGLAVCSTGSVVEVVPSASTTGLQTSRPFANTSLLELPARQLKRELELRGLDTRSSADRSMLLELAVQRGIIPSAVARTSLKVRGGASRWNDQALQAPVVVALKRVPPLQSCLPSGVFTDGERIALPLWSKAAPTEPMWFVLDTAIRRTALSSEVAARLGKANDRLLKDFYFASEPLGELEVQIIPSSSPVLGKGIAGLLGPDFLRKWDLDLDIPKGKCSAWPAEEDLPKGFGPPEAVEIEMYDRQGVLEVQAQLRGTVCSGETSGPPLTALLDLGQTYSACNWAAARQVGITGSDAPCVSPAGQWLDLDGRQMDVYEADLGVELPGRVSGVLLGERVCSKRLFWLAESLPLLETLGFNANEPMVILGLDTIGRARLAISAKHRRLFLPM